MELKAAQSEISSFWDMHIVPTLKDYIRIPNKSPSFDPDWEAHGHMERVLKLAQDWVEQHKPQGSQLGVFRSPGRTPLLLLEIPSTLKSSQPPTVLMYGHLDKQPEMTGWREGLSPWEPVLEGDRLYGRGGADDGYALFASLSAVKALQSQGVPHARIVVLIEFSEESGSPDLPHYVEKCAPQIGRPDLVVCLDSGAGNYEQLWCTTSLRGMLGGTLRVDVLREGVHSGDASGVVPSSFRVLRQLLARLEDPQTGQVLAPELSVEIPKDRLEQAQAAALALKNEVYSKFPFIEGMKPAASELSELVLNRTWRAALSITGQEGLPRLQDAGNVLRPFTSLKLSLRLPPTLDASIAERAVRDLLTREPPFKARVSLEMEKSATGWNAPKLQPWLGRALDESSQAVYGKSTLFMGEGGTIPFMGMLGEKFPEAQFVVTGVLGPHSNAHGPNEFLHIPYAKKLSACVALVLEAHAAQGKHVSK
jgi:acetylornithine deacetylase/succinyl-diaminopimelate desuccinylase-like protein